MVAAHPRRSRSGRLYRSVLLDQVAHGWLTGARHSRSGRRAVTTCGWSGEFGGVLDADDAPPGRPRQAVRQQRSSRLRRTAGNDEGEPGRMTSCSTAARLADRARGDQRVEVLGGGEELARTRTSRRPRSGQDRVQLDGQRRAGPAARPTRRGDRRPKVGFVEPCPALVARTAAPAGAPRRRQRTAPRFVQSHRRRHPAPRQERSRARLAVPGAHNTVEDTGADGFVWSRADCTSTWASPSTPPDRPGSRQRPRSAAAARTAAERLPHRSMSDAFDAADPVAYSGWGFGVSLGPCGGASKRRAGPCRRPPRSRRVDARLRTYSAAGEPDDPRDIDGPNPPGAGPRTTTPVFGLPAVTH